MDLRIPRVDMKNFQQKETEATKALLPPFPSVENISLDQVRGRDYFLIDKPTVKRKGQESSQELTTLGCGYVAIC